MEALLLLLSLVFAIVCATCAIIAVIEFARRIRDEKKKNEKENDT